MWNFLKNLSLGPFKMTKIADFDQLKLPNLIFHKMGIFNTFKCGIFFPKIKIQDLQIDQNAIYIHIS